MQYLVAMWQAWVLGGTSRRWAWAAIWSAALCASFVVVGCGPSMSEMAALQIPKERIRNVCWKPAELAEEDELFAFPSEDGVAVTLKDRLGFRRALSGGGLVFKYNEAAPVQNLKLLPLSRAGDA